VNYEIVFDKQILFTDTNLAFTYKIFLEVSGINFVSISYFALIVFSSDLKCDNKLSFNRYILFSNYY
jgi:hypothetical protein